MVEPWLAMAILGVAGAIGGSFLATLTIRWPEARSVRHGRSTCDTCGARVAARDLIPVLSGLALRGRCRECGARIDPRHLRIELACAGCGGAAALVAPLPVAFAGAVFGWLLVAIAAIDVAELWIPDALTVPLAIGGVTTGWLGITPALGDRLTGGAAGFLSLWLIGAGYRAVRGRTGLGGGDPKLFGAIGLWLGWAMLPAVLLLAALLGLALVLMSFLRGERVSRDDAVPFGALLAAAAYPAWLFLLGSSG